MVLTIREEDARSVELLAYATKMPELANDVSGPILLRKQYITRTAFGLLSSELTVPGQGATSKFFLDAATEK